MRAFVYHTSSSSSSCYDHYEFLNNNSLIYLKTTYFCNMNVAFLFLEDIKCVMLINYDHDRCLVNTHQCTIHHKTIMIELGMKQGNSTCQPTLTTHYLGEYFCKLCFFWNFLFAPIVAIIHRKMGKKWPSSLGRFSQIWL
jgi:hypothetical protein